MSQFNTPGYDIPRTTGICASTGRALEPGETYYAALVDLPEDQASPAPDAAAALGIARIDISSQAWQDGYRPPHLFSFWKSTVPLPNEKKRLFVDDAVLLNLLVRLEDARQPQRQAFRYVLALILMRKKLIRYDATETRHDEVDGQAVTREWWLFTPKLDVSKGHMGKWNEDETIAVLDPQLDEPQIEQVTQQLGEILETEL